MRPVLFALLLAVACYAGNGDRFRAIIAGVYDADTCTALIYQGPGDWSRVEKIRLKDVWAPELHGDTLQEAREQRDWLRGIILGREVVIIDSGQRSGDRMVAVVELGTTNINELVNEKLKGGSK